MRVWTNGKRHLVSGPRGLTVHDGSKPPSLRSIDGAPIPARSPQGWHAREALAHSSAGDVAYVSRGDETFAVPLDGKGAAPVRLSWRVADLAAVDDGKMIAVVHELGEDQDDEGTARIVRGAIPKGDAEAWEEELAVPAPVRVKWPDALIWTKEGTPWSKKTVLGAESAYVTSNAFGTVIAEKDTGIVCVLRPRAKTFECALRVPSTDESQIYGVATKQGVLIVLCVEGRESALCHFDSAGEVIAFHGELGGQPCFGMLPPAVIDAANALVFCDESLHPLSLPALEPAGEPVMVAADLHGNPSAAVSPDGKVCVFGFGAEAWIATRGKKAWTMVELPEATVEPRADAPAPGTAPAARRKPGSPAVVTPPSPAALAASIASAPRVRGEPTLQLLPAREAPRIWTTTAGATLRVDLAFGSVGGTGKGIAFELSGPLLAAEKVLPRTVTLGEQTVQFVPIAGGRARAEIAGVALPAGLVPPPDAKLKTPMSEVTFQVVLAVDAVVAAGDLLTVRVAPLSAKVPGSGSFAYSKRVEIA